MKRFFSVALATVFIGAAFLFCASLLEGQNGVAGLTPTAAEQLLTHNGGVWVLESVGGERIESACAGKFTLQFQPAHQAESVGCYEGGTYSSTSEWRLSTSGDNQVTLALGNETTNLELRDVVSGSKRVYSLRLKLLSVLDPKSGKQLIHEYRFKESASK